MCHFKKNLPSVAFDTCLTLKTTQELPTAELAANMRTAQQSTLHYCLT